jgi:hypothetical protein
MKKFFAAFLLIVFTVETIGLTIIHHHCSMGHTPQITAVNGLGGSETGDCCCGHEAPCAGDPKDEAALSLQAPPCCTELTTYLKLEVSANVIAIQTLSGSINDMETILPGIFDKAGFDAVLPVFRFNIDYSPPHSGTDFLITIKQLKIPFPVF